MESNQQAIANCNQNQINKHSKLWAISSRKLNDAECRQNEWASVRTKVIKMNYFVKIVTLRMVYPFNDKIVCADMRCIQLTMIAKLWCVRSLVGCPSKTCSWKSFFGLRVAANWLVLDFALNRQFNFTLSSDRKKKNCRKENEMKRNKIAACVRITLNLKQWQTG